jgi:hypothetical protein
MMSGIQCGEPREHNYGRWAPDASYGIWVMALPDLDVVVSIKRLFSLNTARPACARRLRFPRKRL